MTIETIKVNKYYLTKQAFVSNSQSVKEASAIMDAIYAENPEWWPYGLNVEGHDEVFLIRDSFTKQAAGFVGWQQHKEGNKLVGSYSIGILPQFRGKGLAKEAVAKVIKEKAKQVDLVKSYVKSNNIASKKLAQSLNVPIVEDF